jgi:O-antigen biosynthesis protein
VSVERKPSAPKVSIVVPAFNAAATIDDCIRSLLRLNEPVGGMEIVAVDNGSTDSTILHLEQYKSRIRILHESIRGSSAARNRGIVEPRGEIVAFTDADCVVDPGWILILIAPLADPSIGATGGRILSREGCNWIERFGETMHDHRRAIEAYRRPAIIGMNFATRRSILDRVGLFDPDLMRGQDTDLGWRIHAAGYQIKYCHDAVVRHRNESTLRGLFFDGLDHGRSQALLRAKYPDRQRSIAAETKAARRTIARSAMRCALSGDRPTNLCELIYTLGKLYGDLRWWRAVRHHLSPNRDPSPR